MMMNQKSHIPNTERALAVKNGIKSFGSLLVLLCLMGALPTSFAENPNPFGNVNPAPPPPANGNGPSGLPEDDDFSPDGNFGFPAPNNPNNAPPTNPNPNPPQMRGAPSYPTAPSNSKPGTLSPAPSRATPPPLARPSYPAAPNRGNLPQNNQAGLPTQNGGFGGGLGETVASKPPQKLADYLELDSSVKGLEVKNFDLPDKDIRDVVTLISKWTGKNFILDNKVRGKITIIGPSQVTLQEAYNAFLSALDANGLTTVQSGKFIRIIESAEARRSPVKTYSGDYAPKDDQFITRIFQLKYINSDEVSREFRDLTTRQGKLFAYEPTNSIIITDTGSNIQRIKEILETLDVKSFETTLHVLRIKNTSAKTISDMLGEIYGDKKGGSTGGAGAARTFSRSSLERTRGGGIITKIIPDEATNSLVVLANQAGFITLVKLVDKLDIRVTDTGKIHVYYCEYAKAEDLAATLSSLSSGGPGGKGSSRKTSVSSPQASTPGAGGQGQTPQVFGTNSTGPVSAELDGGVRVTSDTATNSLVVTANASDYKTLKRVLKKLDIPRLQVFIESAILEISLDKQTQLNVNTALGAPGTRGFAGGFIGDQNSITNFITGTPLPGATLPVFAGPGWNSTVAGQQVNVNAFMGLLNFLTTNTKTSVLSTPQIIALDNEKAQFKVQDEIPVQSSFTLNPGATTTTVGTGNITILKSGIDIALTPQINAASRTIRLQIEQTVDTLKANNAVPQALQNIQKAKTTRVTNTSVSVRDQDYIMLGGLISDTVTESDSKVPLLGDIPILGWLFKSNQYETIKTNLVILLHPRIIGTSLEGATLIDDKLGKRKEYVNEELNGDDPEKEEIAAYKKKLEEQKERAKTEPLFNYRNNNDDDDDVDIKKLKSDESSNIEEPPVKESENKDAPRSMIERNAPAIPGGQTQQNIPVPPPQGAPGPAPGLGPDAPLLQTPPEQNQGGQ